MPILWISTEPSPGTTARSPKSATFNSKPAHISMCSGRLTSARRPKPATSKEFILWVHKEFGRQLPEAQHTHRKRLPGLSHIPLGRAPGLSPGGRREVVSTSLHRSGDCGMTNALRERFSAIPWSARAGSQMIPHLGSAPLAPSLRAGMAGVRLDPSELGRVP